MVWPNNVCDDVEDWYSPPPSFSFCYPTMTELAEQIEYIADHFQYVKLVTSDTASIPTVPPQYYA